MNFQNLRNSDMAVIALSNAAEARKIATRLRDNINETTIRDISRQLDLIADLLLYSDTLITPFVNSDGSIDTDMFHKFVKRDKP